MGLSTIELILSECSALTYVEHLPRVLIFGGNGTGWRYVNWDVKSQNAISHPYCTKIEPIWQNSQLICNN